MNPSCNKKMKKKQYSKMPNANKLRLPIIEYAQDQWSPLNQDGKRYYSKDQLMRLIDDPQSRKKPHNLSDCIISLIQKHSKQTNEPGKNENALLPKFARISIAQPKEHPKRNKQTVTDKGGSKLENFKLNETENAWKPTHLINDDKLSKDDSATQELFRHVRGILNKLTPEKFSTLVFQLKQLNIDTPAKLSGLIELIFEKSVEEPNFSVAYAQLCSSLASIQIPIEENSTYYKIFKRKLLTHCQNEFEKISNDRTNKAIMLLGKCTDSEKLAQEEEERKYRRRSVGIVRFIGELFLLNMLTAKIINNCIKHLLDRKNEESLECLCKLLTTVGKQIETKIELTEYIREMQDIVNSKSLKISSRVRFMLRDVIDLRKNNWISRKTDLNPKTMGQIQKEVEAEQFNTHLLNYSRPRKENSWGNSNSSSGKPVAEINRKF